MSIVLLVNTGFSSAFQCFAAFLLPSMYSVLAQSESDKKNMNTDK